MARQVTFNIKRPTPYVGPGVIFRGFYPTSMGWAKGLEPNPPVKGAQPLDPQSSALPIELQAPRLRSLHNRYTLYLMRKDVTIYFFSPKPILLDPANPSLLEIILAITVI